MTDIWTSKDGITWNDATAFSLHPFTPRRHFKIVNVHDMYLYLVGGVNESSEVLNDVWKSKDGLNWEIINKNTEFSPRLFFTLT